MPRTTRTRTRRPPCASALLGCGNVGGALAEILLTRAEDVAARTGIRLELVGIAVANPDKPRSPAIDTDLIGTDAAALVARDDVDVVVELIGGLHPAHELIETALRNGKPVVTGNKALLATAGAELAEAAAAAGVDLLYEAAVAGAIPVIRPLRESLAGEQILRVMGIVNGTTNYILTRMEEQGDDYDDVLRDAQELGLAERDPTADVEGHDAAAKAAILAALAFGSDIVDADVHREGISGVSAADVAYASRLGYSVKLLAIAELVDGGPEISVRVHPAMVPRAHPLAAVRGAFNAVFVEGAVSGEIMLYGRGAGAGPPRAPCWVTWWTRRGTCSPAPPRPLPSAPARPCGPRPTCAPPSTSAWTSPTGPASWPRSPRSLATTTSQSAPWSRSGWPRRLD